MGKKGEREREREKKGREERQCISVVACRLEL